MKLVAVKKTTRNLQGEVTLQPFFGKNKVIVYRPDTEITDGVYVVAFEKNLTPGGTDVNGKPIFIRKCIVLKKLQ